VGDKSPTTNGKAGDKSLTTNYKRKGDKSLTTNYKRKGDKSPTTNYKLQTSQQQETTPMNQIFQLRDLHGLDEISWWLKAPGWWVVLLSLIVLTFLIVGLLIYRRRLKQRRDWQQAARKEWLALLPVNAPPREQMTFLSILLRRVAVQRHGREACAGLSGEKWLAWLTKHDPQGFDWTQSGQILIELPNMPKEAPIDEYQVERLYRAVRAWLD
jgi:hypothetical protein